MKFPLLPLVYSLMRTIQMLLVAVLVSPQLARAECKEYKIVEYEDRVEAVCVGEPLTEAQKKANLEEEKRQELEAQRRRAEEVKRQEVEDKRQKVEETKRQNDAAAASKAQAEAEATAGRNKRNIQPVSPSLLKPADKLITNPQAPFK